MEGDGGAAGCGVQSVPVGCYRSVQPTRPQCPGRGGTSKANTVQISSEVAALAYLRLQRPASSQGATSWDTRYARWKPNATFLKNSASRRCTGWCPLR